MPEGRVALVTGASSGIGRAIAVELARRGARVMATARRHNLLADLSQSTGAEYFACSLQESEGREAVVEEVHKRFGRIEILVLSAALGAAEDGSVLNCSLEAWRRMMALNLDAQFHLTQLAAADMVANGWGRIVMISSTAGQVGGPNRVAYCASKHGLLGLMRAAAVDLAATGVTCNAILPGWVHAGTAEDSAIKEADERGVTVEEIWREREEAYPAKRVPSAEEVACATAFLCSEDSSGITGETLTVALGSLW